jgi:hypothetical protein
MPNARQLLEQADALMRRNRKRGKGKGNGPPTLTDALTSERSGTLAPTIILPEAKTSADPIVLGAPSLADPIALDTLSDLPVLTDVVDDFPQHADAWPPVVPDPDANALAQALDDALATASDASPDGDAATTANVPAAESQAVEATAIVDVSLPIADVVDEAAPPPAVAESATDRAVDVHEATMAVAVPIAVVARLESEAPPLPIQDEEFILDIPPFPEPLEPTRHDISAPPAPAVAASPQFVPGSPAWEAMAEEVRMQVLQRLDLFTETGMRDQLGARLQPIVARASAELVETINHALGELVRGYVAEAIEREIESWRKRDG